MKQAKYIVLMEDIQKQIQNQEFLAGTKIPSENVLARTYEVSRQTVRKALKELENEGYLYAEHGRGTFVMDRVRRTKLSKNIAVVTTYYSDYIFPRVIQGIDQVLSEKGYSIILKTTANSRMAEARCLEDLLTKDIDGMIIEPSKSQIYCKHMHLYQQMDEYEIPYVFIQGYFSQMREKPHVLMNDCQGSYLITKYLLERGHRYLIGVFKADDTQGKERHKGYVKALQENGILYDPDCVIWFHTEDRKMKPYRMICEMIQNKIPIDGVVSYNDQIAVEVIKALEASNKKVPEEVSVTGFDDSFIAKNYKFGLTTIAHPQQQLGILAAKLLLQIMEGDVLDERSKQIIIEPELIERESTKDRRTLNPIIKKTTCKHKNTSCKIKDRSNDV